MCFILTATLIMIFFFFFQAEDGIRDLTVTGVQTCALPISKSAMESLCRYFAVALARRGITVNAISPGWIEDSVLNALPDVAQDMIRSWHEGDKGWTPMGRLGTPADVGNAVSLLCSADAGWITGQVIAVDGGLSLMDAGLPLDIQRG